MVEFNLTREYHFIYNSQHLNRPLLLDYDINIEGGFPKGFKIWGNSHQKEFSCYVNDYELEQIYDDKLGDHEAYDVYKREMIESDEYHVGNLYYDMDVDFVLMDFIVETLNEEVYREIERLRGAK